jgi:hypothetical protein
MPKQRYKLNIEPGTKKQTWNYEITSPTGKTVMYGAFQGLKTELIERHKQTLKRLNSTNTIGSERIRQPLKPKTTEPGFTDQDDLII